MLRAVQTVKPFNLSFFTFLLDFLNQLVCPYENAVKRMCLHF